MSPIRRVWCVCAHVSSAQRMTEDWPAPDPDTRIAPELRLIPIVADFDAFYESEWHTIVGLAAALTGDRAAAEDLAQDAFATTYRDWDRVGAYDKPGAYVRRLVVNRATSRGRRLASEGRALRRLARRRETALPHEIDETWALVRRLPARQAQVVALTYLADLPLAEVAEALGIGVETAKTHLARAKAALARQLSLPSAEETP